MAEWLVNRILPGILCPLVVIAVSHVRLRRHINRVTAAQTRTLLHDKHPEDDDG